MFGLLTAAALGGAVNAVAGGGSLISFPALLAAGYPAARLVIGRSYDTSGVASRASSSQAFSELSRGPPFFSRLLTARSSTLSLF